MIVTLVVAADLDGVIGKGGGLPWPRLSEDMKRFKRATKGHAVVMGRKTWESLPKRPLVDRLNVVVTRDASFAAPGATVANSLDDAVAVGARFNDEVMIIGGASLYAEAMPRADRWLLTVVHGRFEGDVRIERPGLSGGDPRTPGPDAWRVRDRVEVAADADNACATTAYDLVRAGGPRTDALPVFVWPT